MVSSGANGFKKKGDNMKKLLVVLAMVFIPVIAFAADVTLTSDGKVPGGPFVLLQQQINDLKNQLNSIQLIPGPKGDKGDTGATGVGIQGIAGVQGLQGIPGISLDLSKLYMVTSHHAPGICNDDDVAISCTAECSTHPDYQPPTYPFPAPFYGVPEEVISIAFGINFATESAYAYEDNKPGVCISKCIVPPGTMGAPPGMQTYEANVRVLCMPRD